MKQLLLFKIAVLVFISFFNPIQVKAQAQAETLSQDQLHKTIVSLDSALFSSFNSCNVQQFKTYFAEDLEFYHDKGGPTLSLKKFIEDFEKGLCKPNNQWKSRREVIPGSLKVYPMNKYGAILTGEHRFFETELATGKEYERSTAKFTHLYEEVNGVWKIKRALSYDHQLPKRK